MSLKEIDEENIDVKSCIEELSALNYHRNVIYFVFYDVIINTCSLLGIDEKSLTCDDIIAQLPKIIVNIYGTAWDIFLEKINLKSYKDLHTIICIMIKHKLLRETANSNLQVLKATDKNLWTETRFYQQEEWKKDREKRLNEPRKEKVGQE